jgi:TatD DNase family protein
VAAVVPLDRLLIETDSPFLTPVPHRGRRNEPAYVTLVAAAVAQARGMRTDALAAATTDNALRFFRWT